MIMLLKYFKYLLLVYILSYDRKSITVLILQHWSDVKVKKCNQSKYCVLSVLWSVHNIIEHKKYLF